MRRLISIGLLVALTATQFGCSEPKDVVPTELKSAPKDPPLGAKGKGKSLQAQQ